MRNSKKPARLSSVANALALLKSFGENESELGITALAARLHLSKSTVHRLAASLVQAGMLEQNPDNGRYRLGLAIFELGSQVRRNMDFYKEAKDVLHALRERTGETVNLAILRGGDVIYLNSLESANAVKVVAPVGQRVAATQCVEGKLLLAFADPGLGADGRRLPGERALAAQRATIRERGFAFSNAEDGHGVSAIAMPFFGADDDALGAIAIAGPAARLNRRALMGLLPVLRAAVKDLSGRLGARRELPGLRLVRS